MSIAEKFEIIADRVYDAGKQVEYDAFWDSYQQNGERTQYSYVFAGFGWTDENLTPKYPVGTTAQNCNFNYMFYYAANVTKIPTIYSHITSTFSNTFSHASNLVEVRIEGEIGYNNISFNHNPLLSKDSIINIVNVLSSTTSAYTITFSLTAVNNAFETSKGATDGSTSTEWAELIATKPNWTISLV